MSDWIDQLERLTRLHQSGALTDAEFEAKKAKLLAREPEAVTAAARGDETEDAGWSRRPLLLGAALIALVFAGAAWFGSGILPADKLSRPAQEATAMATDSDSPTEAASAMPVAVALDETLAFAMPAQCLADDTLERVYKKLEAGMNLGSGQGLTVALEGFGAPLEIAAKSRRDRYQAEVADAELRFPAGTTWHGLKVSRITTSRYYPPDTDGQDSRTFNFLEPAEKVRETLARLGFNAPLAPEYNLMEKPNACDGSIQIETRPGGSALVCSWGC